MARLPRAAVLLALLALALSACGPLAAARPSEIARPSSPTVPSATPLPPTSTIAVPTATAASPATATPVATPISTVAPTLQPAALAPPVLAAVASFRAETADGRADSPANLERAQAALATAAAAFVSAGDAGSQPVRDQFARALSSAQGPAATVASVDLDGNGKNDLIVAVPDAGLVPIVLPDGGTTARALLPPANPGDSVPNDAVTDVVAIRALSGNGRPDVVVTREERGASALNTEAIVISWTGQKATALFDRTISDWAGPATWELAADGAVALTCPAFGVYDHKLLPHPQQTRSYRWNGSTFALVARHTDPPRTRRQMMNLAEADLFAGDWTRASQRYQSVIDDPALGVDQGDTVDWANFARFRLGELAALSGHPADAERWLAAAARAKPALGPVANAFLQASRASGAAAGFAAVQQSSLPARFDRGQLGDLGFPVALGPFGALGEGIAAALDQLGDPTRFTAAGVTASLTDRGYRVENVTVADLDGDGAAEVAMVVPFGSHESSLWVFDRSTTGWRATATVQAPRGLAGLAPLPDHRRAIRVVSPPDTTPSEQLLTWNGSQAALATSPTAEPVPVAVNFQSAPGDCLVAEDLGSP